MTKKHILATLFCLMLLGVIAGSIPGTPVVAYTPPGGWPPGQPYFTLYAMLAAELPYTGWTAGYHDVMYEVQKELANIGINLEIRMYDAWTIWSTIWEEFYDVPSTEALPPNGWDIATGDWWISTMSTIWEESFLLSEFTPPIGYNIMSWSNEEADALLSAGIHSLDAETRRDNLHAWQEMFMHDPPMVNLFYPYYFDPIGDYVEGWGMWFSSVDYFGLDASLMSPERKAKGEKTFYLGNSVDLYNAMPLYMVGYTHSAYDYLVQDALYVNHWEYNATIKQYIPGTGYNRPEIAADFPTWPNDTTAIVPIRDDVWWVDKDANKIELVDAYDVKFSLDTALDPATGSPSAGEFIPAIDSVEVLSNATLQAYGLWPGMYEPYAVQINLKTPFPDLTTALLAMHWGAGLLPEHLLGDIPHRNLRYSPYYYDPSLWHFTGPYLFDSWDKGVSLSVKANPHYYDSAQNMTGRVDKVIIRVIPDDATRRAELVTHGIDATEFTWAPIEVFDEWRAHPETYHLNVIKYFAPQSNNIMFNLNNPYLSNRYVRQAIAHAIPYDRIYDIVKGWGIEDVYAGKTTIIPFTYYTEPDTPDPSDDFDGTTVNLFNEALLPYEYNLTKAQKYMDMWYYSQVGTDWTKGPVGDGNFDGMNTGLDDVVIWATALAVNDSTPDKWTDFLPGNDWDPDYDNNGLVELDDFYRYIITVGTYYPEGTKYWQWSR